MPEGLCAEQKGKGQAFYPKLALSFHNFPKAASSPGNCYIPPGFYSEAVLRGVRVRASRSPGLFLSLGVPGGQRRWGELGAAVPTAAHTLLQERAALLRQSRVRGNNKPPLFPTSPRLCKAKGVNIPCKGNQVPQLKSHEALLQHSLAWNMLISTRNSFSRFLPENISIRQVVHQPLSPASCPFIVAHPSPGLRNWVSEQHPSAAEIHRKQIWPWVLWHGPALPFQHLPHPAWSRVTRGAGNAQAQPSERPRARPAALPCILLLRRCSWLRIFATW